MDGYSTALFYKEIASFLSQQPVHDIPVQFYDYCRWQADQMMAGGKEKQIQFWKDYLKMSSFTTALPYQIGDTADRREPSCLGGQIIATVDGKVREQVKRMSRETSTSEATVLLTAFGIAVVTFTAGRDVLIGYRMANRQIETERAIGCF